jgi:hypothetical protein
MCVMASAEKKTPVPTDEIAGPAEVSETTTVSETVTSVTESDDEAMRRRYREALERKRGGGPGADNAHGGPKSAAPTSNDKRQRTFRRKSGG